MAADDRPVVWSVAGSDSGGGAGIQADLRAFEAFEVHGCTALAAITAQNSVAVREVQAVSAQLLDAQLAALADDMPPAVIKTGLLGSVANLEVLARWVRRLRERAPLALVVDPVWRASSGAALADTGMRQALCEQLLPLATVITPNRREAEWLLGGEPLFSDADVVAAARALRGRGPRTVLITGGDVAGDRARDFLLSPQAEGWLSLPRQATAHTHGTGCTFASSMAAAMALGHCDADAAVFAKMATAQALRLGHAAGAGAGPVRPRTGFGHETDLLPGLQPVDVQSGASAGVPAERLPGFASTGTQPLGMYPVVDSAAWVERMAHAGVTTVQLRIKAAPAAELEAQVRAAVAVADRHRLRLFVNDHWQLALQHRAYGVHLGQQDLAGADLAALAGAGLRLGVSTHAPWEVARAHALQPSYYACGPVHATRTKAMPWLPQGKGNLAYWSALLPAPVVAIGGLDAQRAGEAARCGADGVAVLSGIVGAPDPEGAVRRYQGAIAAGRAAPRAVPPSLPRPTLMP
ncbi:bifunctional hydroxymethylpyrimidine kinase/phosphomethylpyrimidine kinase [Ideonella sp. BN130291]|uniref:bifunctional hydroxymethylpyrimidine kinase/phosphomethylpyrimidine kinase n=1 Tax=Ideonella sp. BN130291 TaxID=3112940 RepID=UPI002E274A9C|nr:bifunctional hydroxymethylpyrimidine kinase/phosphomethylpyrimidine kinase [Ideonella sp. BN130291]